jgi:CheY-like chemotaxis protein
MQNNTLSTATKFTNNNDPGAMNEAENQVAIRRFIVVDDDPINNIICSKLIKKALEIAEVKTIQIAEEGLNYIEHEYSAICEPAILFLDINMPGITGWEFLERYHRLKEEIKKHITVYILSSSLDPQDIEKARVDKAVKGFLSKPLYIDLIREIVTDKR